MPSSASISISELARDLGRADSPAIIDVRIDEDFAADPVLIPGAVRRDWRQVQSWGAEIGQDPVVIVCHRGLKLSQGVAAWIREARGVARSLEGGHVAWSEAGGLTIRHDRLPARNADGRTVWVTRERPKVDRIACPWLIRRFVDRRAAFLFVAASEVVAVAERFGATPFDIEGVPYADRGDRCTFDALLADLGLSGLGLERLAAIVRAADTGRHDLAPEGAGLLALSRGAGLLHGDDLRQLDAMMGVYDALYLWCRHAAGEDVGAVASTVAGRSGTR